MLNLVVTCTKDKRVAVPTDCSLRAYKAGSLNERIGAWQRQLSKVSSRYSARHLYAGDHWVVAKAIDNKRFTVNTWVCSAGYGLVNIDDKLTPYSATFSQQHPDTVWQSQPEISAEDWWTKICDWRGHRDFGPRSIAALASEYPCTPLMVVASETYLKAISKDLQTARDSISSPEKLMIISAGTRRLGELTENLLPCDARLQSAVGGIRRSVNIRVARKVIEEARTVPSFDSLSRKLKRLLQEQPELIKYDRTPMSDDEVTRFIFSRIRNSPRVARTPLLTELRAKGYACEQKRFAKLFQEVMEESNG